MKRFWFLIILTLQGFVMSWIPAGQASLIELTDGNSKARIDTTGFQVGMYDWVVDGVDHLKKQWFWYRVGATDKEESIDTLALIEELTESNALQTTYQKISGATQFRVEILYNLTGGAAGSKSSDIGETITIYNDGLATLDFHFWEYTDFDLGGPSDTNLDTVLLVNPNKFRQIDFTTVVNETIANPAANRFETGDALTILGKLTNGGPDDLNNLVGPPSPFTGNAGFAWQWDVHIAPGSFTILKNKDLGPVKIGTQIPIPEPSSLLLLGSGLVGLAALRWWRQRRNRRA